MRTISARAAAQVKWVQRQPGFKRAKSVLEVGAGAFETLAELARLYPGKQFDGVDFVLRAPALAVSESGPSNLKVLKHDVRDLSLFAGGQFDLVFSVALVEHVRELGAHLAEVHRVLKDGGRYCFRAAPLWSSSLGHHCGHSDPNCPIPHYGHLYMTREQLGQFLAEQKGQSQEECVRILRSVYDRKDLSRLSLTEVRQIVNEAPLRVDAWKENKDKNWSEDLMRTVLHNNLYQLRPEDLQITGVECALAKGGPDDGWTRWLRKIFPYYG
jgi:SAM-dependent methyltransferase